MRSQTRQSAALQSLWPMYCVLIGALFGMNDAIRADDALLPAIRAIDPQIVPDDRQPPLREMLRRDARDRLRDANRRDLEAWRRVKSRADWERLRDERIAALKASLAQFPPVPERVAVQTAGVIEGSGYRIERIAYESR